MYIFIFGSVPEGLMANHEPPLSVTLTPAMDHEIVLAGLKCIKKYRLDILLIP